MRDFSPDLTDLRRRLEASRVYLGIDAARARIVELEEEVSKPDLWDDQTLARKVTTELARNRDDVELYDALDQQLTDLETLAELARDVDGAILSTKTAGGFVGAVFGPHAVSAPASR